MSLNAFQTLRAAADTEHDHAPAGREFAGNCASLSEVAGAPCHFGETPALGHFWNMDMGHDLVRLHFGRKGSGLEIRNIQLSDPVAALEDNPKVKSPRQCRPFSGWIIVAKRSAHRAAVPDLHMTNVRNRGTNDRRQVICSRQQAS